jgi:hypothetical protein
MLPFSSMIAYLQRTGRDYQVDAFQAQEEVEQIMNTIKDRIDQYNLPTSRDFLFGEPIPEGVTSVFGMSSPLLSTLAETIPLFPKDRVEDKAVQGRIDMVNTLYETLGGLVPPQGSIYFNGDSSQGKMPGYLKEEMIYRATHLKYQGNINLGNDAPELDFNGLTLSQALQKYMDTAHFKQSAEVSKQSDRFLDPGGDAVMPAAAAIKSIIEAYYKKAWEVKRFIDPLTAEKQLAGTVNPRTGINPLKESLRRWDLKGAYDLLDQQQQEYQLQLEQQR